jgi:hypothetical protein
MLSLRYGEPPDDSAAGGAMKEILSCRGAPVAGHSPCALIVSPARTVILWLVGDNFVNAVYQASPNGGPLAGGIGRYRK